MAAYYNEHDPFAAQWLRELIKANLIAAGEVDERDIQQVGADDLKGFVQCHFFAGIGGWSESLRRAGWSDDVPVWTGSCPCQSFSASGERRGFDDPRHVWPAWFRLIRELRPDVLFGEQVASKDGLAWLDVVSADLEGESYAIGTTDICSAGVGSPNIRQRLYWLAHSEGWTFGGRAQTRNGTCVIEAEGESSSTQVGRCGNAGRMEHADSTIKNRQSPEREQSFCEPRETNGYWRDAEWIHCADGRYRPIEPGTFPLAAGIPSRMDRLRGFGNAINAEVAKAFIEAAIECGIG